MGIASQTNGTMGNSIAAFHEDIRGLTREIVERVRNFRGETIGRITPPSTPRSNCGGGPIKRITRLSAAKTVIG